MTSLMGRGDTLPHGDGLPWTSAMLWWMVGADALIAAACFSIPLAIAAFTRRRGDAVWSGIAWLFSAFILACGVTQLMDIWSLWRPGDGLQVLTRLITAAISVATAIALWRLIPQALTIPSVAQLRGVIESLETEVRKRQSAEDRLHELQDGLAVTLSSIGAGFIATDREGRVMRMNEVAEQLTAWPQAEALGQPMLTVFDRENRPAAYAGRNPVDLLIEHEELADHAHQLTLISRQGQRTTIEARATVTHAGDGSVRGLAMVFRDLTRLVDAEAESKRLAAIVESSSDAIIGKSLDGRITSWNGAAQALFGYSAAEAIGQPVQMLMPADRQDEEMRILAELARGAPVPAFDTVRLTRSGELVEVSIAISPIRDDEGRVVGASKIARNISLQRQAAAALRDSDSLLRTIHMHFIVSITDRAGGITDVNEPFCQISGYARGELIGQSHRIINSGVQPAAFWIDLWRTISAGQPWRGEICNRAKDGSLYWVDSVIAPFTGADGRIEKYISIRRDITAAKRAEGARIEALRLEAENRQIREASRLKSQFLANMSHELRTPLNAIIGFADLLHAGAVPAESLKHQKFLGHIGSSGRHLLQLINDVLDLSKVESGRFEFFPEPVHLPGLVTEVHDILQTAMARKRIVFAAHIDAALDPLVLDPARLKQVLYNYLSNAIKFTPDGGHVSVRALPEGPDHFRLEVRDNGIGIADADLPRLFTEFQQLDAGHGKLHQGTGLGLALTRRLVQAQGGTVGVRSTPGLGSVFHLVLRRTPPGGLSSRRLLVIEQPNAEQPNRALTLADSGFQVDVASSGLQALQWANVQVYDAITLGLRLPDQPGLGVLADIRSQGASRRSPVVGVSMPVEGDSGESAVFAIANLLSKPIRTEEVADAVARLRRGPPARTKVMVVDDDPLALDLMRTALEDLGVEVVCMAGGRQALQALAQHRPDAIVLDLMMPEFDGFATLDALGRLPVGSETPVYIWTSMLLTDDEYRQLAGSARAVLGKGGGDLARLLERLRPWQPAAAQSAEGSDR